MNDKNYWDEISSSYDGAYQSKWSLNEDLEITRILSSLKIENRPVRVLDLGCGTGLGFMLVKRCFPQIDYLGVDASQSMLEKAQQNLGEINNPKYRISLTNSGALHKIRDVGDCEYDLVLALNATASYIARTRLLLSESMRVLRPGGFAFLSFLNRYSARRLVNHSPCRVKETSASRGSFDSALSVPAITTRPKEIRSRMNTSMVENYEIYYQSILGGVWETNFSVLVEKRLRSFASPLGHTINVLMERGQRI